MKQRLFLAALIAAAVFPARASAQQWMQDRRYAEGIGIRVGDLELHPGLGGEFGYDSNFFQRAETEEPVVDALRLRITPSLSLSTLGGQRRAAHSTTPPAINFRASVHAAYNELFATDSESADEITEQRHVNVGASLLLDILPGRPIGADIYGDFTRVGEPSNSPEAELAFDRGSLRAGAGLSWRPGGGLFEWRAGYELGFNYFEEENWEQFDNLQHSIRMRGRWRFLPKTALLYEGNYTFVRYTRDEADVPPNGEILRTRAGINGFITRKLSFLGMIGWMASFYDDVPENADTVTAHAELKYFLQTADTESASTGLSTISLGYSREMTNNYLSSWFRRDRGYMNLSYFLGGYVAAGLEAGVAHLTFPRGNEFEAFDQNRIDARLFAEYRLSNTFGVNTSVSYDRNLSDVLDPRGPSTGSPDDLDFTRWQAYLGLRWFM